MFGGFKPFTPAYSYFGERWADVLGVDHYNGTPWNDYAYGGLGNDVLLMGSGWDVAYGGSGSDQLRGENGNDSLYGGSGNDRLIGGAGADFMDGGTGIDTVDYTLALGGPVTVNLQTGYGYGGEAQGDRIVNVENVTGSHFSDVLIGDSGNNVLSGGLGDDTINGGAGNDVIIGGQNASDAGYGDILTGGAGADRFVFKNISDDNFDNHSPSTARDVITDFTQGEDIIEISDLLGNYLFSGLSNDFKGFPGQAEIFFNWPTIAGYGPATLVTVRDADAHEMQFYVLGYQSLTADDFI